MVVLVTRKNEEDPIKTEGVRVAPRLYVKFSKTASRREVDLCCLQETRWKMEGVMQIVGKDSRYKLFWSGNDHATGGVGVLLAEEWWEKVFEVARVSDRIILILMTIGKTVFVFALAQKLGRYFFFASHNTLHILGLTL